MTAVEVWALEHTVQRGETIESIAKNYSISVAQLIEANPSAADLFYVGLKLNIPEAPASQTSVTAPVSQPISASTEMPASDNEETSNDNEAVQGPGWNLQYVASYGFLKKQKGVKGSSYTYAFSFSGSYWFAEQEKGLFASVGLGYDSANYASFCKGSSSSISMHFIGMPIKVGYAICTSGKNFGITPYIGTNLNVSVAGKGKVEYRNEKQSSKIKGGKFAPDFRIGAMLRLGGFNVGAYYALPISKKTEYYFGEDGYFGVSIGGGF